MYSFRKSQVNLPLGAVWLMNAISEFRGKQELYSHQSPQVLKSLLEMALIESAESSNRIEGVTVDHNRLKPLVIDRSRPRDRSEEEVAGYRAGLDLIHKKYKSLVISGNTIKKLHALSRGETPDAGQWKKKDNDIVRKNSNGTIDIVFKPLSAKLTPKAVKQLCLSYEYSITHLKYPPLYAVACFILDFLCIHPFRDGNGRVSRLLTILCLYQQGYEVGKYISLERIIEQSKETYYEVLGKSSQNWHKAKHDISPWLHYFLGTVLAAYKEFEQRAVRIKPQRGAKTAMVTQAISSQIGDFTIAEIKRLCLGVSADLIKRVFRDLKRAGQIKCLGKGQSARWRRIG